jgi:hypothetical protein
VEWLKKITVEKYDVNAQQSFRESFFARHGEISWLAEPKLAADEGWCTQ